MYFPKHGLIWLVSLCCLAFGLSPLLGQVDGASLFQGMKVAVVDEEQEYPVLGIDGDGYVIVQDGEKRTLPSNASIRTQPVARFSKQFLEISSDTFELTSSTYNQLVQRRDQMRALQMTSRVMIDVSNETVDVEDFSSEPRMMDIDREIAEAAKNPDTIAAKLTVESPWQQPDLYLLGLVYFTIEQDGVKKPAYKGQLVEIGDLSAHESKVLEFEIAELPPQIEVDRLVYHFYSRGEELATNRSEKRRVLSKEETYEYMLHRYLTANAGKTRGPSLFEPLRKRVFDRYVEASKMSEVILNVRVDKEGRLIEVSVASGLSHSEEEVQRLVEKLRFFPSLEKGVPVERRLKLRLSQIAR